jgi:hypothetical protein
METQEQDKKYLRPMSQADKVALGVAGLAATAMVTTQPARADLSTAVTQVNAAMEMLDGIAQTGVGIVIVPFGISFALKIAGHVLRAGT